MFAKKCLLVGALAFHAVSGLVFDPDWPLGLILKRQDDMTEAEYNCHDNCGQAIIAGRGDDPCNDETFLHDYDACLQCAGSDNVDIWQYYGGSLSSVASSCGLSTTPLSGTQAAVSAAITASTAASTAASTPAATTPVTTPSSNSTAASTSASAASGTSASAAASTAAATATSTASSTAAASASATGGASSGAVGWTSMIGSLSLCWAICCLAFKSMSL